METMFSKTSVTSSWASLFLSIVLGLSAQLSAYASPHEALPVAQLLEDPADTEVVISGSAAFMRAPVHRKLMFWQGSNEGSKAQQLKQSLNGDPGRGTLLDIASSFFSIEEESGTTWCTDPRIKEMIDLDNHQRRLLGLPILVCSERASQVAYEWSVQMCIDRKISHDGFKNNCSKSAFRFCGENVAFNSPPNLSTSAGNTHIRWMNSRGHRANILRNLFQEVGYGYYVCSNNAVYWSGFFGMR